MKLRLITRPKISGQHGQTPYQLVMSRKNSQPAGFNWNSSSRWSSLIRTSRSVVPKQLNLDKRSWSNSQSTSILTGLRSGKFHQMLSEFGWCSIESNIVVKRRKWNRWRHLWNDRWPTLLQTPGPSQSTQVLAWKTAEGTCVYYEASIRARKSLHIVQTCWGV